MNPRRSSLVWHWAVFSAGLCRRPGRLLWLAVVIGLPLVGLVGVSQVIGWMAPPDDLLLERGDCPSPCWAGLRLGSEQRADVRAVLDANALFAADSVRLIWRTASTRPDLAWRVAAAPGYDVRAYFDGETLARLDLFAGGRLDLGQVLAELGPPEQVRFCRRVAVSRDAQAAVTAVLVFDDGTVEAWVFGPDGQDHSLRTGMPVQQITFRAPAVNSAPTWVGNPAPWMGFGRAPYRPYSC